jgi:hypothetical protein
MDQQTMDEFVAVWAAINELQDKDKSPYPDSIPKHVLLDWLDGISEETKDRTFSYEEGAGADWALHRINECLQAYGD